MRTGKPKILVVDDEAVSLTLIHDFLSDTGYDIILADQGHKAWELLTSTLHRFSLVILDRLLPDLDGMSILNRMKQHTLLRTIPVIMLTSKANKEEVIAAVKGGIYDFLLKPIDKELLTLVIQRALRDGGI